MKVLRDFLVLTAVAALIVGHLYMAVAELPLDLHDWSTRCQGLLHIYVDASGQLRWREHEFPSGLDAFRAIVSEEGRVLYCIWEGIYLLLQGREVLDARMGVDIWIQPEDTRALEAIRLSTNLGRAFASVERFDLGLKAHGLKSLEELRDVFVEVVLDIGLMQELLASYPRPSAFVVWVSVGLAFLTKTHMEVLRPRGMAISAASCFLLAVGLVSFGRRRPLSARDAFLLLASLALMAAGDILLHLAWYRLANLGAYHGTLAPPPILSPGPWNKYYEPMPRILPDEEATYRPREPEVEAASQLAGLSWLMLLAGLSMLAWLARRSGLFTREVELCSRPKIP